MEILRIIIQIIIPLGIFNVWFLRQSRSTSFRGGSAQNLKEEFAAYGLPEGAFYLIGAVKITAATLLLIGFLVPLLVGPAALLMAGLMLGAVVMHAKAGDPAIRYMPAILMLAMSLFLVIYSI